MASASVCLERGVGAGASPAVPPRAFRAAWASSRAALLLTALLLLPLALLANARLDALKAGSSPEQVLFEHMRTPHRYEVAVFGTSRAASGVDPTVFERSGATYNFSVVGASARMVRFIIEHFLDRGNRTGIALIEVNAFMLDPVHQGLRPSHLASAAGRDEALSLARRIYGRDPIEEGQIVLRSVPLWRDRAPPERLLLGIDWFDPVRAYIQPRDPRRMRNGFAPLPDRDGPDVPAPAAIGEAFAVDPGEAPALEATIDRLRASGARVVLFTMPTCRWSEVGGDAGSAFRGIAAARSLHFLDYQHGLPPSATADRPEMFFDWTHLAEPGAVAFSRELWRDVRERLSKYAYAPRGGEGAAGRP